MQYAYKRTMNRWSQVITGVEFNCIAATQGAHHVIHLIYATSRVDHYCLILVGLPRGLIEHLTRTSTQLPYLWVVFSAPQPPRLTRAMFYISSLPCSASPTGQQCKSGNVLLAELRSTSLTSVILSLTYATSGFVQPGQGRASCPQESSSLQAAPSLLHSLPGMSST